MLVPGLFSVSVVSPSKRGASGVPFRMNADTSVSFLFRGAHISISCQLLIRGTDSRLVFFHFHTPTRNV